MQNKRVIYITQAAIIAALYAVLTIGQNALLPGTASAAVQFRVAEVLCVLAIYTPAAIPGLTIGCIIANISSVTAGLGVYDMVFGSLASLLAAIAMYLLRNVRIKNIPFLALLMPAIFNIRRIRCSDGTRHSRLHSAQQARQKNAHRIGLIYFDKYLPVSLKSRNAFITKSQLPLSVTQRDF